MEWNEYLEEVRDCAISFMEENVQHAGSYNEVHDMMIDDDSVTGNASGSFTMNRAQAEENIEGIVDDPEVLAKFSAIGYTGFPEEAETVDVIARIIALDELYPELEEWFDESR